MNYYQTRPTELKSSTFNNNARQLHGMREPISIICCKFFNINHENRYSIAL